MMKRALAIVALLMLAGCVAPEKAGEPGGAVQMLPNNAGTQDPYLKVIEQFSRGEAEYRSFYNQFTYKATVLNSPIREALLLKEAEYFKWDPNQLVAERERSSSRMNEATDVFMSFYTPERRNDNLTDTKSIWRVYLDTGGKRYEGKAKKARKLFAELNALYPYHTRWNTPYLIEFAVPTTEIEPSTAKLIVTGPLGSREVEFPPAR